MLMKSSSVCLAFALALPSLALAGNYVPKVGGAEHVAGEYVLTFDAKAKSLAQEVEDQLVSEANKEGIEVKEIWRNAVHGALLSNVSEAQAKALSAMPGVAVLTPNVYGRSSTTQLNAPPALDRIDQTNLPLNGTYNYTLTGSGVHAYVIDGVIYTSHSDFAPSRATNDFNAIGGAACAANSLAVEHATEIASILGGTLYGVAKGVRIHGIQATACANAYPTTASMISAANWVVAHGVKPGVVNVSINVDDPSHQVDTAYSALVSAGFFVSASAGNTLQANPTATSCSTAPSRVPGVFSVGGSALNDTQAVESVGGNCISAFAPMATAAAHPSGFRICEGTSCSAPQAAGAAALLYQSASPYIPPATSMNVVLVSHTSNVITNTTYGAPGRLLYTGLPW